ncbi:DJ-1/PfpI family protein, partial [Nocardia cyriacigeorgica]|uniref:DJ-1/PfpI family protein n=1 Tax=Nocardia cyriacigeorgica TaxID=135487 RepID=UPI00273F1A92
MLDYTGPAEVFVDANQSLAGYDVVTVSPDGCPVVTSLGTQVCVMGSAMEAAPFDTVLIPGSELPPARFVTPEVLAATAQMARRTRRLAS